MNLRGQASGGSHQRLSRERADLDALIDALDDSGNTARIAAIRSSEELLLIVEAQLEQLREDLAELECRLRSVL